MQAVTRLHWIRSNSADVTMQIVEVAGDRKELAPASEELTVTLPEGSYTFSVETIGATGLSAFASHTFELKQDQPVLPPNPATGLGAEVIEWIDDGPTEPPVIPGVNLPELPREEVDVSWPALGGQVFRVRDADDFRAALNSAIGGDTILLEAQAVIEGNFELPARVESDTDYVLIASVSWDQPGESRVSPQTAGSTAKIQTPNNQPAIRTAAGAHHYRFAGVEIRSTGVVEILVSLHGNPFPHHLIFDRCYIHGTRDDECVRGILAHTGAFAAVNCDIRECKSTSRDSQAIVAWDGTGPYFIEGCRLEGSAENVMFGGADPETRVTPSDITIRNCLFSKPDRWNKNHSSYAGTEWDVKNLFELKHAHRVLVEDCVFQNNWVQADQAGYAILITPRNQYGGAPWSGVEDVTFRNNVIKRSPRALQLFMNDDEQNSQSTKRVLVQNNSWVDMGSNSNERYPYMFQLGAAGKIGEDIVIQGNDLSMVEGKPEHGAFMFLGTTRSVNRFVFTNNVVPHLEYGVHADEGPTILQALETFSPGYTFTGNHIQTSLPDVVESQFKYPEGNTVEALP